MNTEKRVFILTEDDYSIVEKLLTDSYGEDQNVLDRATPVSANLIAAAPDMYYYIQYVEGKIQINEMPMTFEQWKQAEIDMKEKV